MRRLIVRWGKWALAAVLVLIPAAIAFSLLAFEVSSQPQFCGSCHIMTPYYESWKTSSHGRIACVECHIPPGVESELRKKYEALSMVARYFTGTYSTNPWTEVDDKSCLRSGCHEKRVLVGRELYQGVLFDHQPHLNEMRRQKKLRCTSCHSQIVQGSHIKVTPSTCFLCHFKNTAPNTGTARCTLCHAIPERIITTGGISFDHSDVKRFGMDCMACHEGVIKGTGEVLQERCFSCHNEQHRVERYGETEFLHRMHVTDHKVECTRCHVEIQHGIPARDEALSTPCEQCHSAAAGHSPVRDLYRGIGAKGVAPRPAVMFIAGIRCEACHNQTADDHKSAREASCMTCHGAKYLKVYRGWVSGLAQRMEGLQSEFATADTQLAGHADASASLMEARQNYALLQRGHAIHNPPYAADVARKVHQAISAALTAAGLKPLEKPWVEAPYDSECLGCHVGVELVTADAFGAEFPHTPHVAVAGLRCTVCHGDRAHHGQLKLTVDDCATCHDRIDRPMADVSPEECLKCHSATIGPIAETVRFPHEKHIAAGLDCTTCHQTVGDKPHRDYAKSPEARPKPGHELCGTCHSEDVPAADGNVPEGARCGMCHTDL